MPGVKRTPLSVAVDTRLYVMGITRNDFAIKLAIGYQHLSNILCGRTVPTIDMSNRMSDILEISSQEIRRLAAQRKAG